ncbi:uncharacterized protein LOC143614285 [Bidens hawaiensis]|uniref:uncharacterized protein LOC143614285 n=1 Tax=Bidens hawaiensis TaxID=980011 RepID=UPI004049453F
MADSSSSSSTTANRNSVSADVTIREVGGTTSYQCPLLSTMNYTSWAVKMESFMDAQGIWDAIEPPEGDDVDVKVRKKARAFIFQALPEDILLQVACHKEAKDVWNALKVRYLGAERVQQARIQTLNREFELLSMKEADSIDDYASKIGGIMSKFQTLGTTIEEKVLVKKLLTSAPTRFLPIVATIEQYSNLNTMPFEEIVGRLKAYEERIKPVGAAKDSSAPITHRGRGRGRGRLGSRGRGDRHPSNNNQRPEQADQNGKRCYNCDRLGHFVANCRVPRRTEDEANLAREDDDATLLMVKSPQDLVMLNEEKVFPSEYAKDSTEKGVWYLDNGASNHMTGERIYFSELDEKTIGCVKFGDGSTVEIRGKGSILLQCKNGDQRLITNVYYIPDLCNNILSLGQFDEVGCKTNIENGLSLTL